MSLRLRLLLALVGLVAAGLLVAGLVTYFSLQSFLITRVDQQLAAAKFPALRALQSSGQGVPNGVPAPPPGETAIFPPGTYAAVVDTSGRTLNAITFTYGGTTASAPALPADLAAATAAHHGSLSLTVSAVGHESPRYRVLASQLLQSYTLVTAIPLTEVSQTLDRLLLVEGIVTASVLVGLGLLAWWLVRRELRPLDDMAVAAGEIAAGDLARRVAPTDARTEVGRLGLALNAMLAQIEGAFADKTASEVALRRFLAQASHELRTPLASVRGYAELFRRGAKERPEDLDLAMRRIEQESARMGVLVEELLLLARLDEGRPLERGRVDLSLLAADAIADAHTLAPDRSVTLYEAAGPVIVRGDEPRLRQIAANLIANALQHAGDGARIDVTTEVEDGWAVLEVRDDGAGMDDAVAAHAFERFFRGAGSQGPSQGTAGLGLAIVRAIVDSHGGEITLETARAAGARFRVRLPLAPPGGIPTANPGEATGDTL